MWEQYIASFLGGGFTIFVLQWVKEWHSERRRRRTVYLEGQLTKLYGPLHFFMSQNVQYVGRNRIVLEAYKEFFEDTKWSEESYESLEQPANDTIDLANTYVKKIRDNNEQMMRIMRSNWHLMDIDDIEVFSDFMLNFTRREIELESGRGKQIPFRIRVALQDIRLYDSTWVDHVKAKLTQKRQELGKCVSV